MKTRAFLAIGLLLAATPLAAQLPATPDARAAAVARGLQPLIQVHGRPVESRTIEERLRATGVPAVSVAVIHGGKIDWARAWGLADVEARRPATTETLFQAASMSKPIAALAVMTLVDAGESSLDVDVNEVLRTWQVPENEHTRTQKVTLRRLLSHTAGTTVHGFPGYAPGEPVPTTAQVLAGAKPANTAAVVVDTIPGTQWRYSGGGYTIAQQWLAERTGRPFAEVLRARVLEPLGMNSSTYEQPLPDALHDRAATAYRGPDEPVAGRFHTYPEMAAAGLWTTPSDYARYALGVRAALQGEPGAILSRDAAREMLTEVMGGYGVGPGVAGAGDSLRFSHGGANAGFRSFFVAWPHTGDGIVVMTNSDDGAVVANEIVQAAARVYGWPGFQPRTIHAAAIPLETLDDYVGVYRIPQATLTVTRDGERLLLAEDDGPALELVPTMADTFVWLGGGALLRFERNDDSDVVAARAGTTRVPRIRQAP